MFQYPDGVWNNGEGFRTAPAADIDSGGWFDQDVGLQVGIADVHAYTNWHTFTWQTTGIWAQDDPNITTVPEFHPDSPQVMRRFVGYLRPGSLSLPTAHPFYPNNATPYVDNAAFEVFAPTTEWDGVVPIVVTIGCFYTIAFPEKHSGPASGGTYAGYDYRTVYPGIFSPDGLIRLENPNEASGFAGYAADLDHIRRAQSVDIIGSWQAHQGELSSYYPIAAYIVPPVAGRQTELIMQRNMQLVQAIKLMLQSQSLTPLPTVLSANDAEAKTAFLFVGGSNGGFQAMLGALLYPNLVHGAHSMVFSPSLQRVLGEQEMGQLVGHLSGFGESPFLLDVAEIRNWGQFAWNRGFQMYDLSILRRFLGNETIRPFCFYVGDEDITSTGTDWILPLIGSSAATMPTPRSGKVGAQTRQIGWASAENADHNWREITDPYTGNKLFYDFYRSMIPDVLASKQSGAIPPALSPLGRQAGESLRGIDDPHEWFLGRVPTPVTPPQNAPLAYDSAFFDSVQPGAAGTWLGAMESILIFNQHIYVGGTEGFVSSFHVDWNDTRRPLIRDAQSPQLGQDAWGIVEVPNSNGDIIVGTRRHLHRLHADLTLVSSVELPVEEPKPYRMHMAEVDGNSGPEVVYASAFGGLVAYNPSTLTRVGEYPEPGVRDFCVTGTYNGLSVLSLLSERGVVANLVIDLNAAQRGTLTAASPPQNGVPLDLDLAVVCFPGYPNFISLLTLYVGDDQGLSFRAFRPDTLQSQGIRPHLENSTPGQGCGRRIEMASARWQQGSDVGDHILVLNNDTISTFDASGLMGGAPIGMRSLFVPNATSVPPGRLGSYTPAMHACAIAVGDLGEGSTDPYKEEVVVATESGHLVWMTMNDLIGGSSQAMPVDYQMYDYTSSGGSAVQPHTNQSLSCAWGLTEDPGDPTHVHLFDQDGNHWRVDHAGTLELRNASFLAQAVTGQVRGARYLGVTGVSTAFPIDPMTQAPSPELNWTPFSGLGGTLGTRVWCPIRTNAVILEKYSTSLFRPNNWSERDTRLAIYDGFGLFPLSGDVIGSSGGADIFWWSKAPMADAINPSQAVDWWGNLLQGMQFTTLPSTGTVASGVWASTDDDDPPQVGGRHDYLDLRNVTLNIPSIDQQSVKVVQHPTSGTNYVILGCPGGKVRILEPGAYCTVTGGHHGLGQELASSEDYGHGASALAVTPRQDGTGVDIYLGLVVRNARSITNPPLSQPLQNGEVMTGRIVRLRWNYGVSGPTAISEQTIIDLEPSTVDPRGGYGVVGLYVDDVLPNAPSPEEKEVVATTLAGDVFIYTESGSLVFRATVPGAAGFYNSILARDLNQDGHKELYIAGSMGLHRFTPPID